MTIGDRIRILRTERRWTQDQLAEKCGLNRNSIYKYEKNETMPRMPQLKRLAKAFDTTLDWLQSGTIDKHSDEMTAIAKQRMNEAFDALNPTGQQEAAKRIHELTQISEYRKEKQ